MRLSKWAKNHGIEYNTAYNRFKKGLIPNSYQSTTGLVYVKKDDFEEVGFFENPTTENFIRESNFIHKNKYDYSKAFCSDRKSKIDIICSSHGLFRQDSDHHIIRKQGCPKCSGSMKLTKEEFVSKALLVHNGEYSYEKVNYINTSTKVIITCKTHGDFLQRPMQHLRKEGCFQCGTDRMSLKQTNTTEEFIKRAKEVHGPTTYDYSLVDYTKGENKVKIICRRHGVFIQNAFNHLQKHACPKCKETKGERTIRRFLENNNIEFESQKKFCDCLNPKTGRELSFDFHLPYQNILIEFDGRQHSEPGGTFGGHIITKEEFNNVKYKDRVRNRYCRKKGIRLIRIPYTQIKNVNEILSQALQTSIAH